MHLLLGHRMSYRIKNWMSVFSALMKSLCQRQNVLATDTSRKRGRKDFVSPKLVAALDRCQLSIRDSVYIIQATVEALGFSTDEHPIDKSSIQMIQSQMMARAKDIKSDFQDHVPDVSTVHWDGKLLPGLNVRSPKEERLRSLIIWKKELLLAVPKLDSSSGKLKPRSFWMRCMIGTSMIKCK